MKFHILPAILVLMSFMYFSFKWKHKTKMSFIYSFWYITFIVFSTSSWLQSFGDLYLTMPIVMIYFSKDKDVITFSKSLRICFFSYKNKCPFTNIHWIAGKRNTLILLISRLFFNCVHYIFIGLFNVCFIHLK